MCAKLSRRSHFAAIALHTGTQASGDSAAGGLGSALGAARAVMPLPCASSAVAAA
eukprot:SAG31_NODE_12191_length_960_cov_1.108014_1_plen_54_part_10